MLFVILMYPLQLYRHKHRSKMQKMISLYVNRENETQKGW